MAQNYRIASWRCAESYHSRSCRLCWEGLVHSLPFEWAAQARTRPQRRGFHGRFSSGTRGVGGCGFPWVSGRRSRRELGPKGEAGWARNECPGLDVGAGVRTNAQRGARYPFSLCTRAPLQMAHPPPPKRGFSLSRRRHVVELEWFVLLISHLTRSAGSTLRVTGCLRRTPCRKKVREF